MIKKENPLKTKISGSQTKMNRPFNKNCNFIKAKKSLGQNFCIDERIPNEIIKELAPNKDFCVWEIGPGKGALTKRLIETGADIHLFEIDKRMEEILESLCPKENITWGDFLELDPKELPVPTKPLLVCGNLPYYCGTHIIKQFLEKGPTPSRLVFLLQHEVALKASVPVNHKEYSYLSVHTALFAKARIGNKYGPASFVPQPKIDSSVLILEPFQLSEEERQKRIKALKFISALFTQRRKIALSTLKRTFPETDWAERFAKLGIDEKARPENISPEQFLELFDNL